MQTLARLDCRSHESRLALARAELKVTPRPTELCARAADACAQSKEEQEHQRGASGPAPHRPGGRGRPKQLPDEEAVKQAAIDVGHCEIRAPFDAVVTGRLGQRRHLRITRQAIVGPARDDGPGGQRVFLRQNEDHKTQASRVNWCSRRRSRRFPVSLRALLPALDTRGTNTRGPTGLRQRSGTPG